MKIKITDNILSNIKKSYEGKYINNTSLYKSNSYDSSVLDDKKIEHLYSFYDKLEHKYADSFELIKKYDKDIRLYAINDDGKKPIILLVGGVHGDEKSSVYGLAYSVQTLLSIPNKSIIELIKNYSIFVIPCLNVYGFNKVTRKNDNDVDLNRDFGGFKEYESQVIKRFIDDNKKRIKIVLDSHNCGRNKDYYPISFVAPENAKNYDLYEDVQLKLRFFLEDAKSKIVDLCMIPSPNHNTFSEYINKNGFIGHTLETPRCIIDKGDQRNYKEGCETTKNLIINSLLIYTNIK